MAIKTKKAAIKALKDRDFETDKELVQDWKQELLAMKYPYSNKSFTYIELLLNLN